LSHEIEALNVFVKPRIVPVRIVILMPGHSRAKPGILNE